MKTEKILKIAKVKEIPFLGEEVLTAHPGFLVSEEAMSNIVAAVEAAEKGGNTTELTSQLETARQELSTAQANLQTATQTLTTTKAELKTANDTLSTTQTQLQTAQKSAKDWEATAVEFGAKPGATTEPLVPASDPKTDADETAKLLAGFEHNQKADRLGY